MNLQEIEARNAPLPRDPSICRRPADVDEIHTLSAENNPLGRARFARPCPITSCEEPYIGDESISRPPAAKKARMTSAQLSRASASLPTLKVIQDPRPTIGNASPLEGIALVSNAPCWPGATEGQAMAAAPHNSRRRVR